MINVILVADEKQLQDVAFLQMCIKLPINIVAKCAPGQEVIKAIRKYNPDLVLNSAKTAALIYQHYTSGVNEPRDMLTASTHQGIQLLPIAEVNYFQAGDKYVTAHHNRGELLIEDTLSSLEVEFKQFVRIHRKTLVAINKIDSLYKNEAGQYLIKLRDIADEFVVSRRQLPKVRKVLLCK
jgi:DNA-binding LytR/AlgR family response regulator